MPPSPPVGGEGWGEAAATLFVPVLGARQLVRDETDFAYGARRRRGFCLQELPPACRKALIRIVF